MKTAPKSARGRCEYCGEALAQARVSVYRYRHGRHVLFRNVRARVCRVCGHRYFGADAIQAMEHGLRRTATHRRKADLAIVPA